MQKITIKTSRGNVSWGMNNIKYLIGNNIAWKHEIMSILIAHFSNIDLSEYDEERFSGWRLKINDQRHDAKKIIFIKVQQYYDYETHAKMTAQSIFIAYINELSKDVPYSDEYTTYNNIYQSMMADHTADNLNLLLGEISLKFDAAAMTPKVFQKSLLPRLEKDSYRANGFNLSLNESITLQCAIITKFAGKAEKDVVVVYDGPLTSEVQKTFNSMCGESINIMCIINVCGDYMIKEVDTCLIVGNSCTDLSDEDAIVENIEMEMPYVGDRKSLVSDLKNYTNGQKNTKNAYLDKIFGHL